MRTKPSIPYNGITIVIDKPSRHDKDKLISGVAATWMEEEVIKPFALDGCDIRDSSCWDDFLPHTNYVALLGRQAAAMYHGDINKHGYPFYVKNHRAVIAFYPQDCCDHRNIEGTAESEDDAAISDRETKDTSPTKRSNYRFWTAWHVQKLLHTKLKDEGKPDVRLYPDPHGLEKILSTIHNEDLYLDIETSRAHRSLSCIGISSSSLFPRIYVIPIYDYLGNLAYSNFAPIYRGLSKALTRNTVVIHNSMFDLTVLCGFYRLPYPRKVYDTMLAQHRCFPEIEKSLGHAIPMWTWQGYHKDQNTEAYNRQSQEQLWMYNARDVFNLKLIKDAQLKYAATIPGLLTSIDQANSCVVPYLINSLTGLTLNRGKQLAASNRLQVHVRQYERVASILTGKPFNPNSSDQCKKFFHDKLNYPVVARSEKGGAKLGSKQLYQLMLKHDNPLIPVILKYRAAAKDLSMLNSELLNLQ